MQTITYLLSRSHTAVREITETLKTLSAKVLRIINDYSYVIIETKKAIKEIDKHSRLVIEPMLIFKNRNITDKNNFINKKLNTYAIHHNNGP